MNIHAKITYLVVFYLVAAMQELYHHFLACGVKTGSLPLASLY